MSRNFAARPPRLWKSLPPIRALALSVVASSGFLLSLLLFNYARSWESRLLQSELDDRARERVEILRTKMLSSMEVLHSVGSFFATRPRASRDEFRRFVAPALARQPELGALGWTPRVTREKRAAFEAAARADGVKDFEFVERDSHGNISRAPEKDEYFPVYFIEPEAANHRAEGFDLESSSLRQDALMASMRTREPRATAALGLVQGPPARLGFVVYLAVFDQAPAARGDEPGQSLSGFASAVFQVDKLLNACTADLDSFGLSAVIADAESPNMPIYTRRAANEPDGAAVIGQSSAQLDIAGRHWVVTLRATPSFVAARSTHHAATLFFVSLLLTFLLTCYLYRGMRETGRVERRVLDRTVELSREIAERKRAEEAARIAESKYRSIFENSVEGIFQTSLDGRYLSANNALARIYGYDNPRVLVQELENIAWQLYVDPSRRQQFVEEIQRRGIVSDFESQIRRRDGSIIWISENARAVRNAGGEVTFYEGTVVDVTVRKEAEDSLKRAREELEHRVGERTGELAASNEQLQAEISVRQLAEKAAAAANRAKSDFLARMSHEIRTPMNAVLGYAQLLHRDSRIRGEHREAVDTIISSGRHLLDVIDDVLDLSKIEAGHVELQVSEFDLGELLESAVGMFRERAAHKSVDLRLQIDDQCRCVVSGDGRKLRQVLINLLGNAVKFTDNGLVTLKANIAEEDRVRFEVSDTGHGIAPEAQQIIFEPFRQGSAGRSRGGTGLGLAIARQHILLMGGELSVTSTPGEGSRFYFALRLPAAAASRTSKVSVGTIGRLMPGQSVRALVVDDLAENRAVLAELLKAVGCDVETAAGGRRAIKLLHESRYDIAFMDVLMPEMDGVEAASHIRSQINRGQLKLVAVTAAALAHEQDRCREAGFDDVISKPIVFERVCLSMSALLGVSFEAEDAGAGSDGAKRRESGDADEAREPEQMALAPELLYRLQMAAESYRMTELKAAVAEVEKLGAAATPWVMRLRQALHAYDMKEIAIIISRMTAAPGDAGRLVAAAEAAGP